MTHTVYSRFLLPGVFWKDKFGLRLKSRLWNQKPCQIGSKNIAKKCWGWTIGKKARNKTWNYPWINLFLQKIKIIWLNSACTTRYFVTFQHVVRQTKNAYRVSKIEHEKLIFILVRRFLQNLSSNSLLIINIKLFDGALL